MLNNQFFKPGFLLCWAVVVFEPKLDPNDIRRFMGLLLDSLKMLGKLVQHIHLRYLDATKMKVLNSISEVQ
jgi:hypothetical protein